MPATPTPPSPRKATTSMTATMRTVAHYSHLGLTLAISVVGGALGGRWLDTRWETEPWLMLLGSFLGIGAGLYHFIKSVLAVPSDSETPDSETEDHKNAT